MPVNPIESGTGALWRSKQTAQGTIASSVATTVRRLRKVGDDELKPRKTNARTTYVDGQRFSSPFIFADKAAGEVGVARYQAQLETVGYAFAQMFGTDTVTGSDPDYTHTIVSGTNQSPYQTFWQTVGTAVGPHSMAFWDAKPSDLEFKSSAEAKVAEVAETITAMKVQVNPTLPTTADSGTDSFLWTENCGSPNKVTVAGVVLEEVTGEMVKITSPYDPKQGQCLEPIALVPGRAEIGTMRNFETFLTDNVLDQVELALFASSSPAANTRVASNVVKVALESEYVRSATRGLKITTPNTEMTPDDFGYGPRSEGGIIPVTLGGQCVAVGGTPAMTIVVKNGESASYVA